jgi:hypothetical protein
VTVGCEYGTPDAGSVTVPERSSRPSGTALSPDIYDDIETAVVPVCDIETVFVFV